MLLVDGYCLFLLTIKDQEKIAFANNNFTLNNAAASLRLLSIQINKVKEFAAYDAKLFLERVATSTGEATAADATTLVSPGLSVDGSYDAEPLGPIMDDILDQDLVESRIVPTNLDSAFLSTRQHIYAGAGVLPPVPDTGTEVPVGTTSSSGPVKLYPRFGSHGCLGEVHGNKAVLEVVVTGGNMDCDHYGLGLFHSLKVCIPIIADDDSWICCR